MKTLCIVQARMGSSRLPGKVIKPLCGVPLILHSLRRLKQCKTIDHVVLATSDQPENAPLVETAAKDGFEVFSGSEDNVLSRYYEVARKHRPETVVRCTGDCPVLDPVITDHVIHMHHEFGADYTSNALIRSYPRGMDTEVFSFSVLEKTFAEASLPEEKEHVTPYIYRHRELFKIEDVVAPAEQHDPELRLCVDTVEDFQMMEAIFKGLYAEAPYFSLNKILDFLKTHPELLQINKNVEQKKL